MSTDNIKLHGIHLQFTELSQASYHDGDIDISSFYDVFDLKNDTYEGYIKEIK